jgi:glycosyltransferase involved in cell wall biosynthesis
MKLTVCMITYNEKDMLNIGLRSALTVADEIVIVDGYSNDGTWEELNSFKEKYPIIKLLQSKDNHDSLNNPEYHFGKAKQLAVDNATGDWILWLDADECLADNLTYEYIHEAIERPMSDVMSLEYIHFINNFSTIDNSVPIHIGLCRLHKRRNDFRYDHRKNHTLPEVKTPHAMLGGIIFHLGYLRGINKIYERYKRNLTGSTAHPGGYMRYWRDWHYLGDYPTRKINMKIIPKIIREAYDIEFVG